MEIVVKIPDDMIKSLEQDNFGAKYNIYDLVGCLMNGTPLPKGHGDLIDRSKIGKAIPAEEDNCTGIGMTYDEMDAYNDGIDEMYEKLQRVKPIIEADKEDTDEEE
jgi:hypothetical protein